MQGLFNVRKPTSALCYVNMLKKSHFFPVGSEKTFDKILVPIYNLEKKNSEVATEGNTLNLRRGFTEREKRNLQETFSRMGKAWKPVRNKTALWHHCCSAFNCNSQQKDKRLKA